MSPLHSTRVGGGAQGSALSPFLYTMHVADIPTDPIIKNRLFADNILFHIANRNVKYAHLRLQRYLDEFSSWLEKWRIKVVCCDIHLEPIQEIRKEWERKHGAGKIVAYSCDLTIDDHVLDMFRHIKEQLGGVDVMVCCAEYFPRNSLGAINCDMKMWRKVINSNVVSPALCTVETVRSIDERGVEEGHIVLLGHMSGIHIDPRESMHVYSVTKYSYNAMVEAFRHALIVHELPIRITQIIPSVVDSRSMNTGVSPLIKEPLSGVDIANTVEYVLSTPLHCQINDVVIRPTEEED
uniref:(California timema) hypothetical protein n=1 Tax=Timema californicum TaxID=61474 RepID=A0A7R9PCD9_TIMCA|nr:unnamed protein product [Timema californicum]